MKNVEKISVEELTMMAEKMYGNMVKAVIDIKNNILIVDAELHADQEQFLLEQGSKQEDLWGVNLYPDKFGTTEFIEYDSMINIRPRQKNMSRGVEDLEIRRQIVSLIELKIVV